METLKAIYEAIGTPYPRGSLIVVMILGAAVTGGIWWFMGKQVAKDHQTAQPKMTGNASSSGPNSPANTGNNNTFNNDQPPPKK